MVTKKQLKKLERALEKAANLGAAHANAVRDAEHVFEEVFGEDVPEESYSIVSNSPAEEVGSLFNNFVNHSENMSGTDTVAGLVQKMADLMSKGEES